MLCAAYFKSGLGNFINAIPSFIALSTLDEREQIDFILDKDWTTDPRVPAIKMLAENSYYIAEVKYWPDVDLDAYEKFYIPVQCEPTKAAREMLRRNKEKGYARGYIWPNALWKECNHHEIDVNFSNVKTLGYMGILPPAYIPMDKSPNLLPWKGGRDRAFLFCLCNGAFQAKFWEKKKWPYFTPLAKQLKNYFNRCKIVGVGGNGELDGVTLDYDFTGRLNILQTCRVINDIDYMITTDTGCMHIADVLRKKGLALFGPTLISKNGSVYNTIKAVRKDIPCAPCQEGEGFYTCNAYACMDTLTPDLVTDRIIKDFK